MLGIATTLLRPFRSPGRFIFGLVVSLIPLLNFAALGFAVQLLRAGTAPGVIGLPEWKNWRRLFIDGFIFVIVATVYLLPSAFSEAIREPMTPGGSAGIHLWVSIILLLGGYALVPVAMVSAVNNGFFSAFAFHKTFASALSVRYVLLVIIWIFLTLVFLVLGVALSSGGWLFLAPASFAFNVLGLGLFAASSDHGRGGEE